MRCWRLRVRKNAASCVSVSGHQVKRWILVSHRSLSCQQLQKHEYKDMQQTKTKRRLCRPDVACMLASPLSECIRAGQTQAMLSSVGNGAVASVDVCEVRTED
jgi:hypothetical protein